MSDDQFRAAADLGGGVTMPMTGFGTWRLRGNSAYDSVRYALETGYRHLDTATMYGNEAEVGRAIRDSGVDRHEVFITTKLPPGNAGRERATIDASLRDLGTDHVDLWLIHWPPGRGASPRVQVEGYSSLKGTNLRLPVITEVAAHHGAEPAQVVLRWHLQHNIGVIPKSSHRERIESNFALTGFSLTDAEMARLDALSRR